DTPFEQLAPAQQRALLHGTGETWIPLEESGARSAEREARVPRSALRASRFAQRFQYKGLFPALDEASRVSFVYRHKLDHLVSEVACSACGGSRLRDDAAASRFADRRIGELCNLPIGQTLQLIKGLRLTKTQKQIAGDVLRE